MLSVILLAAGESRRMGERNKLLLPFHESCFLAHIADQILASKPDELLVVVGHEQERTRQALTARRKSMPAFCAMTLHQSGNI